MGDVVEVRRATAKDWRAGKRVRLRALADAPEAFASTVAREEAFDDDVWRRRVGGGDVGAWFLARLGARVVGVAVGVIDDDDDLAEARQLVGMWVAPEQRGSGAASSLLSALRAWAVDDGAPRLTLWVAEPNARARRFYERFGFHDTGQRQPMPNAPGVPEVRMRLDLAPARDETP